MTHKKEIRIKERRTLKLEKLKLSEKRFITVGMSNAGQVLIVAHVGRHENIRVISACKATRHEQKHYEEKD
jgi:uncharacterized DUF497 family protein